MQLITKEELAELIFENKEGMIQTGIYDSGK